MLWKPGYVCLFLLCIALPVLSRFLGGSISWTAVDSTVTFSLTTVWKRSGFHCQDFAQVDCTAAQESDNHVGVGDQIVIEDRGAGTNFYFGDGAKTGFRINVDYIDRMNDIARGTAVIMHTYSSVVDSRGQPWEAGFSGCCRPFGNKDDWARTLLGGVHSTRSVFSLVSPCVEGLSATEELEVYQHCRTDTYSRQKYYEGLGLNNNPRGNFRIVSVVDLVNERVVSRVDGQPKKRSPTIIVPLMWRVGYDETRSTPLYASYMDGTDVTFRLATSDEMGGIPNSGGGGAVAPMQPPQISLTSSGILTINTNKLQLGYWHTTVVVESTISSTAIVADFIIDVANDGCNSPPLVITPTPGRDLNGDMVDGREVIGKCNVPVAFNIKFADTNDNEELRAEMVAEPSSTEFPWRPLYSPSSSFSSSSPTSLAFSWTVPCDYVDVVGSSEVCFHALDSDGCNKLYHCCNEQQGLCGYYNLDDPYESVPNLLNPSVTSQAQCSEVPLVYPATPIYRGVSDFNNATSKRAMMWSDTQCVRISWSNNTGCMNPIATNYNKFANIDDGNCVIPILTTPNESPEWNSEKAIVRAIAAHQFIDPPDGFIPSRVDFAGGYDEICAYSPFDPMLDSFQNRPISVDVELAAFDSDTNDPLEIEVFGGPFPGFVNGNSTLLTVSVQ
mmetsp:Transcript_28596/g.72911  ORF Transcript_28596/g.72911 Transcript_28596/m.72911 type:complete len:670 (-) Transcript_28596:1843-3852(-)